MQNVVVTLIVSLITDYMFDIEWNFAFRSDYDLRIISLLNKLVEFIVKLLSYVA